MDGDETTMCDDLDFINDLAIVVVDECVGALGPEWPLLTGSAKRALRVSLLEFLDV
jgi:hypothetical protein